jgi:hypothetical protein
MLSNLGRKLFVWGAICLAAILNGALREKILTPRTGEQAGHVLSTLILMGVILLGTIWAFPWMKTTTAQEAWLTGALWLGLTLAFEFLAGHFLFLTPWRRLLADYKITRGRLWVLIPLSTLIAPILAFRCRGG